MNTASSSRPFAPSTGFARGPQAENRSHQKSSSSSSTEFERRLVRELCEGARACEAEAPGSWEHFVQTAILFIELMTGHIQREDQVLFRLAEAILDKTDNDSLSSAFRHAEVEIGRGVLESCERKAAELERVWAA